MLLSDRDIKKAVESGRVKLDPYTPELIQPAIDLSFKYGIIKASFPAKDFIATFAS